MSLTSFKLDQILKWVATAILIIGSGVNSLGFYPQGPLLLGLGGLVWLSVSIMWKEWSLIVTNATLLLVNITGLLYTHFH
jgi:hypothetical protein